MIQEVEQMNRTWKIIGVTVLMGGMLLTASPVARASVLGLFGWHKVQQQVAAIGGSTAQWEREAPGTMDVQKTTTSLAEAREFLGNGVTLPPSLEGSEMLLYREMDKEGKVLVIGLSAIEKGFWARYRPANDHQVNASYGSDFIVEVTELDANGRTGRLVKLTRKDAAKKAEAELWIHDGNWVYELHNFDVGALVQMAESME